MTPHIFTTVHQPSNAYIFYCYGWILRSIDVLDSHSLSLFIYLISNLRGSLVVVLYDLLLKQPMKQLQESKAPRTRAEQAFGVVNAFNDL